MHLAQIWTYPVKSMKGVVIESAQLHELGVVGDRRWALRDLERGNLANCRQTPGIMSLAASAAHDSPDEHVVITLDDHRTVTSSDPSVHEVLSQALGRQVQLVPLAPRDDLDFFRRKPASQPPVDPMAELRGIFGRESDEPLPDFAKFGAGVLEFESPPGTFHDCFPLMVMTTSALQSMTHAVPGSVIDVRRFRPSFVVVGIGLNIGWAPEGAASLLGESGRRVSREEVMAVMLNELDELLSLSPEQLHDRYRRRLSTLNREVRVELPNSTFVEGRALDVESDGRLVVLDSCGATHRLDVGDIVHLR
ncbi:MAG: hypothetical protein RLZZ93_1234 [Actinomycetota bacterium]